jgi:molecular chaperone GrpE
MSEERRGRRTPPAEDPAGGSGAAPGPGEPATDAATPVDAGPAAPEAAPAAPAEEGPEILRDRWLRAEAELQNYRRRAVREREETRRSAEEAVMFEVIAALDDLDRALAAAPEAGEPQPWTEGVRMVANRLVDYLARQGVVALDPLGQPFDPVFHDAVLEMAAPGVEPGRVTQVVSKGWRRGERALRAARVVVARAPDLEA